MEIFQSICFEYYKRLDTREFDGNKESDKEPNEGEISEEDDDDEDENLDDSDDFKAWSNDEDDESGYYVPNDPKSIRSEDYEHLDAGEFDVQVEYDEESSEEGDDDDDHEVESEDENDRDDFESQGDDEDLGGYSVYGIGEDESIVDPTYAIQSALIIHVEGEDPTSDLEDSERYGITFEGEGTPVVEHMAYVYNRLVDLKLEADEIDQMLGEIAISEQCYTEQLRILKKIGGHATLTKMVDTTIVWLLNAVKKVRPKALTFTEDLDFPPLARKENQERKMILW
ncbi:protein PFC0760c-like [Macadamia integrifolia]|uniref:protein PFC0760c-like n=1 Tax=Macadamia integrifolia TaxID=60698 RepID=UPI001C52BB4C|nr:protein PFC0760c-like [Macadamia integrifolia]